VGTHLVSVSPPADRRCALAGLLALGVGSVTTLRGALDTPAVHAQPPILAPAQGAGEPAARVLVLLDGAEHLQPPDYGYTGDWVPRLQHKGYEVVARDPGSLPGEGLRLEDFALAVIAFPATLPPNVVSEVVRAAQQSGLPVLVAATAYVEPLGLGRIWDPANPNRTVYGTTVDIDPQAAGITGGLVGTVVLADGPGLEEVPYEHTLYRNPIVPAGPVLGWITDETAARQAVWSLGPDGTRMYLGIWWSADGRNHNASYWRLFDGSVAVLVAAGRGQPPLSTPTPLRPTVATPGAARTPTPGPLRLPRTGGAATQKVVATL
jgi:hypothetical protein